MVDAANRKQLAVAARAEGLTVSEISQRLASAGIINPQTGKPFSPATIHRDITASEIIGEASPMVSPVNPVTLKSDNTVVSTVFNGLYGATPYSLDYGFWAGSRNRKSYDGTRADYYFWDRIRHGRAVGFKFAGLFCRPATRAQAAFVWGDGPNLSLRDEITVKNNDAPTDKQKDPKDSYTNRYLDQWISSVRGLLFTTLNDVYGLGDQFIITNPDCSISIASPDMVSVEYDAYDYRHVVAYTITTRLDKVTITDRYTAENRTVITSEYNGSTGLRTDNKQVYANLIGRIPIVLWTNDRGANELTGRPIYDAAYHLFERMDLLLEKLLDGVELHGNPIPVIQGLRDIQATLDANSDPSQQTSENWSDGSTVTQNVIDWNRNGALLLGEGGTVAMLSPHNGFTQDIMATLSYLVFLLCMHIDIPEFMLGSMGDSGNRNLTDNQFKVFVEKIKSKRMELEGVMTGSGDDIPHDGLLELADIQLRMRKLIDPNIVVRPVKASWPHLSNEEAQVTLQKTIYGNSQGWLRPDVGLSLLDLVSNPEETAAQASEYYNDHPEKMPGADPFQKALNQASYENMTPGSGNTGAATPTENPAGGKPA